jgi:outer membrane protein assembly factor BamB
MKTVKRILSGISILLFTFLVFQASAQSWSFNFGKNHLVVPVVVHQGNLYIAGEEGVLHALDAKRGSETWKFTANGAIAQPPLVTDDYIYFCTKTGRVYCLKTSSGKLSWMANMNTKLVCSPVLLDDMLCIYSRQELIGLDKVNGLDMWRTSLKVADNPALAYDQDNIYFADDMSVYAFEVKNGKLLWKSDLKVYGVSDVLIDENKLYYVNNDELVALDKSSGKKKWSFPFESKTKTRFQNKPTYLDGKILVSQGNMLFAIDAKTGEEIWTFKSKLDEELHSAVVQEAFIYLSSRGKDVFKIETIKGKKIESYSLEIDQESMVVFENNVVIFTTEDGYVHAFKLNASK